MVGEKLELKEQPECLIKEIQYSSDISVEITSS